MGTQFDVVDDVPVSGRFVTLRGGRRVPYPEPTSAAATRIGKGNRRSGTAIEVRLRSELHRRGCRFRKDHPIVVAGVRVRPDVVFTAARVAVFVDGCFWHCCPDHGREPTANSGYWGPKLEANRERDERVNATLITGGWTVVRIWEHEPVEEAARLVMLALRR